MDRMMSGSSGSTRESTLLLAALLGAFALAGASHAADGVLEINQSCAVNTGCFTGDAAGFPVTIASAGSYALTGNLDVGSANVTAIQVQAAANSSTVDLNGFSIVGPVVCSALGCNATGTGIGIDVAFNTVGGTTIRNGVVRGMGSTGVFSGAIGTRIQNVTARDNAGGGINASAGSVLTDNVALFNGGTGISGSDHSVIERNVARSNGVEGVSTTGIFGSEGSTLVGNTSQDNAGDGIVTSRAATVIHNSVVNNGDEGIRTLEGSTVIGNSVRDNTTTGLTLGTGTGYANNVVTGNLTQVSGGIQIGTNVCDTDTICP